MLPSSSLSFSSLSPKTQSVNGSEAYQILRRAILDLYLCPGAILSIKDICDYFGIGRSPVRDALLRLDQEGLVNLLPQRGTMISQINLSRVEQERFLRISVEEEVMKIFMARHTPSDVMFLSESLRNQQKLCDGQEVDIRQFLRLDDEFHNIFYTVADKLFCMQTVQNASGHYRRVRLLTLNRRRNIQETINQHDTLVTAFRARDTALMRNTFHMHLSKLDHENQDLMKAHPNLFKGSADDIAGSWHIGDYLHTIKENPDAKQYVRWDNP